MVLSFTFRTLAANVLLQKIIMNLTQIPRRFLRRFFPQQFGLLAGIFFIIGLFCAVQIASSFLLSWSLHNARLSEQHNQRTHLQQLKVDQARVSLLAASDLLNRAGVYFMQDKETGSVGSSDGLLQDARTMLSQSQKAWQAWLAMGPPKDEALLNSYQQFSGAIEEQLNGLQKSQSIDAFFAVPVQAFQSDFNDNYARFQAASEQRAEQGRQSLMANLSGLQQLFILAPAVLLLVALLVWRGMSKWVIVPLRHLIAHIKTLAEGDLSQPPPDVSRFNREVTQISTSLAGMQKGLQQLVTQVSEATGDITGHIVQLSQSNEALSQQAKKQTQELEDVTRHIASLESHVEGNSSYAGLARERAQEASLVAAGGDQMMVTVNTSMQTIVDRSAEMRGIVAMIDSVAFQTNILALNAAIEAAHAGNQGRGFAVVAKEVGLLARQSSESTQTIQGLINHSLQGIEEGSRAVGLLEDNLQQVTQLVGNLSALLTDISQATLSQGENIHQMTRQLHSLNQVAGKTGELVSSTASSSRHLETRAQQLTQAVMRFRLPA
ncbi:methyl-accepting chemotaxis sensory transducer with TarH sensor [Scandinavium goeteborgense]|uniref:Methyl-accepting chemotaxis sensory transducer with TarH sensor n=2 Tax=Scandinavium goeteborgense TaxID=1851514 RepID=A0A4R6EGL3_SCAGO|nr:methyl-accepting chemotaxis sensory transducer with TarH sensor [Scandinavium goeteborgense]